MESDTLSKKDTMAWIVVLAIAITCCAILFVVFANYLVAINKNLSAANARLSVMEANESQLLAEVQSLHHAILSNNTNAGRAPPPKKPSVPPPVTQ